jgi:hypothetical protein
MSKVILKKSSVAAKIPLVTDLDYGELAINYADGKLYYKKSDNTIDSFLSGAASGYTNAQIDTLVQEAKDYAVQMAIALG